MSGVVAITFTEAAAAQMASRVSESLAQIASKPAQAITGFDRELLAGQPDDKTLARRALSLVGALDHLRVRTIHSYCWNLLTSYPISARVSPDLRIDADGRQLEEITRKVVEATAKRGYAAPSSHPVGRLALRQVDANRLSAAAVSLISEGVPAQALEKDPFSSELCDAFVHRLQSRLDAAASMMAPFSQVKRAKNAVRIVHAVAESLDRLTFEPAPADREAVVALLKALDEIWSDTLVSHLGKWARSDLNKTESDLIGDQRQRLAAISFDLAGSLRICKTVDVPLLEDARMALAPILRQVEDELRARGLATYNALLSESWALLAHHPDVRRRERARIDQLLVDEFQDTDRIQCALVRILGLDGDKQDNPGLFVVGDPKQSIYGWRNADLGAYDEFKSALKSAGGVFCHLERNFRSTPTVLEEVDRAIAPVMLEQPGLQPAFRSLVPAQAPAAGHRTEESPAIEYWVSWRTDEADARPAKAKTLADDAAEIEASAIARDILKLHRRDGTSWNDFALLLRSTGRLEIFLEAFRRAGVPFAVTSDKHYYRRREIIDLAALVRSIINPVDHVALVTLLRSATVGVPDAALLPLWQLNFPAHVTELKSPSSPTLDRLREIVFQVASSIPTEIPGIERVAGWELSLMAALENLAVLRHSIQVDPADRFIELLRHRFLSDVTEAARYLGLYRLANLDSFFRRLERSLEEQSGDVQAVLRTLRRSVSRVEEAEQALPEGATESGVQVMTIHKAKGLEFDHVYLAQLHARGRSSVSPSIQVDRRWIPGETPQFSLFGAPTLGFDEVSRRDREIDDAEQVRTLYVAMTRAKRRLVMTGKWPSEPAYDPRAGQISYIDLLSARENLPDSFDTLFESCRNDGRPLAIPPTSACDRFRYPLRDSPAGANQHPPYRDTKRAAANSAPGSRGKDEAPVRRHCVG
jgi:ATP-dependent helicase/nuclease subunit A